MTLWSLIWESQKFVQAAAYTTPEEEEGLRGNQGYKCVLLFESLKRCLIAAVYTTSEEEEGLRGNVRYYCALRFDSLESCLIDRCDLHVIRTRRGVAWWCEVGSVVGDMKGRTACHLYMCRTLDHQDYFLSELVQVRYSKKRTPRCSYTPIQKKQQKNTFLHVCHLLWLYDNKYVMQMNSILDEILLYICLRTFYRAE